MPMNWGPEADARLFAAVLKVHEIKVNYAALATEMGSECSAKAITHRIAKIKSDGKASASGPGPGVGAGSGATPAITTPKRVRGPKTATTTTPKTPLSNSKKSTRRASVKPVKYAQSDDEEQDGDSEKEFKNGEGEGEGESPSKKVKVEQDGSVEVDGV